jgi:hypothetical protein
MYLRKLIKQELRRQKQRNWTSLRIPTTYSWVLSVTEGPWSYCGKYTESLEPEFRAFQFEIATEKFK